METQHCPSTYSREREDDRTTYTCIREAGHPGTHKAGLTEMVTCYSAYREPIQVEAEIGWADWEAFLAAQRTAPDDRLLELGAALVDKHDFYEDMLTRQPRYAALTSA
ncbi:hypothetical protein HUT19_41635 (plasmid) [Streptomyces sp. NA02950]|uniref:hypothetical protein n=1 Tax=Streptomyces sp. NA02950 TaxID=2742137 RepID=UPI001590B116|nr:hypothetical protein [Streptomyces sp. NA02950]QKV98225.1 hypothetical protein HUT19_41635 [Streptomyces sp. NA02950]